MIERPVSDFIYLVVKRGGPGNDFYLGFNGQVIALYPIRLNLTELQHPNIVPLIGAYLDNGDLYLGYHYVKSHLNNHMYKMISS